MNNNGESAIPGTSTSADQNGKANANAKRRGPFFDFNSTSVNFWSKNPLANLFRKSAGRKEGKRKKSDQQGIPQQPSTLALQSKRSSSCDALNQPRLTTRFDVVPPNGDHQQHPHHYEQFGGTLMRNGTSKKKKSAEQTLAPAAFNRGSQQSSSFSSLLHHRIFLSSRGASPLVPHKLNKNAKIEEPTRFGTREHRRSSKSQQNIPRIIESSILENGDGAAGTHEGIDADGLRHHRHHHRRRDHSLGAIPSTSRVRQVPIVHLGSAATPIQRPSINGIGTTPKFNTMQPTTSSRLAQQKETFFYERRQEFLASSQEMRKTSWEERGQNRQQLIREWRKSSQLGEDERQDCLALEEWMMTQPISFRKLEQHERIRLKMAGWWKIHFLKLFLNDWRICT